MARILLIDDDDAFRGMLRQVLEREGIKWRRRAMA
jgi:DNA-binding NtrC family response regulator